MTIVSFKWSVHFSDCGILLYKSEIDWNFHVYFYLDYDPCCAYPCENQGICMSKPDRNYTCDCTGTGYYGTNCEIRKLNGTSCNKINTNIFSYKMSIYSHVINLKSAYILISSCLFAATWSTAIKTKLKPDPEWLHTFITSHSWLWAIINRIPFIHKRLMTYVYLCKYSSDKK